MNMFGASGIEMKYALKKGAAWGTAVQAGAGDGLLLLPTGVRAGDAKIEIDDSQGLFWSPDGTPGQVEVAGDLPGYLRYDGCDLLLALLMGAAGVPALHAGGAASYDYVYDLADSTDGLFATFVRHWKNYVEEIRSLKITALTIKGERGKPLQLVATGIGDFSAQDGTNTLITFEDVTIAESENRIHFAQSVFRLNDRSDAALDAGDVIGPNSFELTAKRTLQGIPTGTLTTGGAAPRDIIDEPVNSGRPEISLKLGFPYHTSKTRLTDLGLDTRKKCDITFTGAVIEGAIPRLFKLEFPHLQYKSVDVVDESGIIKEPVEFVCHASGTAPTGMAFTTPFRISGTNQNATDPLA
jgi:hypothetical protein